MRRVTVSVPARRYDVVVGAGVLAEVGGLLTGRRRAAVVSQPAVAAHYAGPVRDAIEGAGAATELFLMGEGEEAKVLATVEDLARGFAAWGLLRDDAVVALGGGVVGDTAGFAAACYYRGVDVVQVPTTLLAQVDSAVGGKTGVNLPEGKNLVGAFHHPLGVVADVETLASLPEREYRSGLGEVAKYALMDEEAAAGAAEILERETTRVLGRDPAVLTELVARCVAAKAAVVEADPGERTGRRALLNLGHTLAHALETAGGYDLFHGEAVAVGLVFAAELAGALERVEPATADRHREILTGLGLPVVVPGGALAAELLAVMARDKKARGGLTFVLPGSGGIERVDDPPSWAVERALRAVGVEG